MNTILNQFIQYALKNQMINQADVTYSVNLLLDLLKIDSFEEQKVEDASLYDLLDAMLDYAVEKGLCEDTVTDRDLFDTRIMNTIMPRPSEVVSSFESLYKEDPQKATDWYYGLSIHSNYIRKSRTDKNINYICNYKYGDSQISINLSKPEKDPKEIAKAKLVKASGYPKCLLCKENVGYAGHANHPARQNHRIIPLHLKNGSYYLQYSPYVYYNEHCIILNGEHIPMKIDRDTFENLFSFVEQFPHYMAGSNTDIPIVGGSILTHDHYQGGRHHFPIEDARVIKSYEKDGIKIEMLYWPLSTIRMTSSDPQKLIDKSVHILQKWISYSDESLGIINSTGDVRHNAITPIVRKKDGLFQIDLVLRNNRTTDQYPDGIFHPHKEHHHVKKENIGLIEVMGLAILPGRLKTEIDQIRQVLEGTVQIEDIPALEKHTQWIEYLRSQNYPKDQLKEALRKELAVKFVKVLENAGVFKMDEEGIAGFDRFLEYMEK